MSVEVVAVPPPPPAPRRDLVEVLHGIEVSDPFRPLEDGGSAETRAWARAHNERTEAVLSGLGDRAGLRRRLGALLSAPISVAGAVAGDRIFSLERRPPQDQAVLVVRPAAGPDTRQDPAAGPDTRQDPAAGPDTRQDPAAGPDTRRVLVDPVRDGDTTAAIDWYRPSPDGRLVAYGRSTGGDERSTLHVIDVDTGEHLDDRIPHTRACSLAWLPDGSAFAYTRYPDPTEVGPEAAEYGRTVWWHHLGGDWRDDELVWGEGPDPTAWPSIDLSPDGRWLIVHLSLGWSRVDVHLVDRRTGGRTVMIEGVEAVSGFTVLDDRVIGTTTLDADRGRIVTAPLSEPGRASWRTIVAESDRVIEGVATTAGSLLVASALDGVSRLDRYDHDGGGHRAVALPELGSLAGLDGSRVRDEGWFSFTSFTRPATLFRWTAGRPGDGGTDRGPDVVTGWTDPTADGPDPTGFVVEQVSYDSTDGTPVPMLLVRAAATTVGPDTPCVLSAYGGFGISQSPAYSAAVVAVCQDGGIYAVPAIRGGGERGESWHDGGKRQHKQQSYDDFLAAADWLVASGRTSRDRLAIRGGSNGGLLMGAAVTQRPDLCRAVQIAVPLADMVRFPRFLIARLWIPEYGDPEVAEELAWLHAYSPYHRVVDGTCYPAVLLTTAEGDSRVDPLHARKLAARLAEATACGDERPILLRQEAQAGHGQGKPVSKQADELADVLSFLRWQLGWTPTDAGPAPRD